MDPWQERIQNRRRIIQQLQAQNAQPYQTQMVSGRVVPFTPGLGMTQLAQSYLYKKQLDQLREDEKEREIQKRGAEEDAINRVMSALQGNAPSDGIGPSMPPDYEKAALLAASPDLSGNRQIQDVTMALLRGKTGSTAKPTTVVGRKSALQIDPGGSFREIPYPESFVPRHTPEEKAEAKELQELAKGRAEKELAKTKSEMALSRKSDQIRMLDESIDKAKEQSGWWTTGVMSQALDWMGGTPQHDLSNTLESIKANIGFDKLQQLREESPTGGALGQVSDRENTLLQAVWGSVKQSQTEKQLDENLDKLKAQVHESWKRIADAYEKDYGKPFFEESGAPDGVDPELWAVMTEEEKSLWK